MATNENIECFWSVPLGELSERLATNLDGLTTAEARRRARDYGPNRLRTSKKERRHNAAACAVQESADSHFVGGCWPFVFFQSIDRRVDNHCNRSVEQLTGILAGKTRG